jgi:predicted nucleic acid binding AN1-type Zn finger protein
MELPNLGKHCQGKNCNLLDYLPYTCNKCKKVFCDSHFKDHTALNDCAGIGNVTVPVCPICNKPVPVGRDEDPNVRMNMHISTNCKDPEKTVSKKAFVNICSVNGCSKKEAIPFTCKNCKLKYIYYLLIKFLHKT